MCPQSVGKGGNVEIIGEVGGVLVVGGEQHDDAVVGSGEVVEVDGAVGVDDERGGGGGGAGCRGGRGARPS